MAKTKIMQKENVLTCGTGPQRVILDYDANLVYQYDDPSNIVAVYDKKRWIVKKEPYYSRGGWGSGSSGDWLNSGLVANAHQLLRAIGACFYEINMPYFYDEKEIIKLQRQAEKIDALEKQLKKSGVSGHVDKPEYSLKMTKRSSRSYYDNGWKQTKSFGKGRNVVPTVKKLQSAIAVFLNGKGKKIKCDSYVVAPNLVTQDKTVVAFRDKNNNVFMNSQYLDVSTIEKNFLGGQSVIQKEIRKIANYTIPFNVLDAAKLKLSETTVLENGPESDHNLGSGVTRHFTGALLLENHGHKFLMDIDRQEIKYNLFNVFFVEVKKHVKTIEEAYDSMMPDEVKQAIRNGIEVKRQGEWFFIDAKKTINVQRKNIKTWLSNNDRKSTDIIVSRYDVAHGKGRPNSLYRTINAGKEIDDLVCGNVSHSGREHKTIDLGAFKDNGKEISFNEVQIQYLVDDMHKQELIALKLWKLVPNTTVANFTITGDVD
jgi:hypothetical protein